MARSIWVATYFLSPHRAPVCPFARHIELQQPSSLWRQQILQLWQGLIDPSAPAALYVVRPQPAQNADNVLFFQAFVLVVQHETPARLPVLFTYAEQFEYTHVAAFLPAESTRREVFHAAGLSYRCLIARPTAWCIARYGATQFGSIPLPLEAGANVDIQIFELDEPARIA